MTHRRSLPFVSDPRSADHGDDWRSHGLCRDEDPELFFPIGHAGPALIQTEQAKTVCRRCPVKDACLNWALDGGIEFGVWGGMSEDERRATKRRGDHRVLRSQAA